MATLGAEFGCQRYLASTVVTGSGQRSSTFLAKLRRNSVFVLALRAFHCRPRRKQRATFTARVTSRMIDATRSWRGGAPSQQNWPADDAVGHSRPRRAKRHAHARRFAPKADKV